MSELGKVLRRLRPGKKGDADRGSAGIPAVLTGREAVFRAEADLSRAGGLSEAAGLALAGLRARAYLTGSETPGVREALTWVAGRHLPLVVHLECRAGPSPGIAAGTGHDAYHAVADTGFFLLFARNVQEAVDLGMVARRLAEKALVPGLVAFDGDEVADSLQDVRLPDPELARRFLGDAAEDVPAPTPAQEMLFGPTRRRVPLWFDRDRPVLHGASLGASARGLGTAARRPFFLECVPAFLEETFTELAEETGRRLGPLSAHALEDAEILLVAQGSVVETAEAVADHLRSVHDLAAGVVGVRCLRPFPGARIAELLRRRRAVVVLERVDAPLAEDPPLARELKAVAARALETGRLRTESRPTFPAWKEKDAPRFHTAWLGLGGFPVRAADVIEYCLEVRGQGRSRVYLGVDFAPATAARPKRQVLLDRIRRGYPEAAGLGLRIARRSPGILPGGALTVTFHRGPDGRLGDFVPEAARLLGTLRGGRVRSRRPGGGEGFDPMAPGRLIVGPGTLKDPGDDVRADVAVVVSGPGPAAAPRSHPLVPALEGLSDGGALLIAGVAGAEELCRTLPGPGQRWVVERNLGVWAVETAPDEGVAGIRERLLGGLVSLLAERGELVRAEAARVHAETLEGAPEQEREERLAAFRLGGEGLRRLDATALFGAAGPAPEPEAPRAVRRLGRADERYDSLARFWNEVGALYREREVADLTPDPHGALGSVPPLSSTFRDLSPVRESFPRFDPARCTGCGACWVACPEGAVRPVVLGVARLLEAGLAEAKRRACPADVLRGVISPLATQLGKTLRGDPPPATLGEGLRESFSSVLEKMAPSEERRRDLGRAFDAVVDAIGELPVARTALFFDGPEAETRGSGELVTVAIHPDACKGCGACVRACEPEALCSESPAAERIEAARRLWHQVESLPGACPESVERLSAHPEGGRAPAALLACGRGAAMAGGDDAEPGSGERLALRLVLEAAESVLRPARERVVQQVEELQERLGERIREALLGALPTEDLDALARGLRTLGRRDVDLATLASRLEEATDTGHLDGAELTRRVESARELADLRWRLARGVAGSPRARIGLVLAGDSLAGWSAYPHNPFAVPAVIDGSGDPAELAAGIMEGLVRETVEEARILRRGKRVMETTADADRAGGERCSRWEDLAEEERRRCPPLLVIAPERAWTGERLGKLAGILRSDKPFKVVVLADAPGAPPPGAGKLAALGLTALAHREAFVLQSSVGFPDHLVAGVADAVGRAGPALVHVHGPSPRRDGFAADRAVEVARGLVESRAFPLFRYDPAGEGVFGTRLDLRGNPDRDAEWVSGPDGSPTTFAEWAAGLPRFAADFAPVDPGDPDPVPLAEFLRLPRGERAGRTPFVVAGDPPRRRRVAPRLVAETERAAAVWRTLQELAGRVTPFTERVREDVSRELTTAHETALDAARRDYERRLAAAEAEVRAEMGRRLQRRLLTLAGFTPDRPGDGGTRS